MQASADSKAGKYHDYFVAGLKRHSRQVDGMSASVFIPCPVSADFVDFCDGFREKCRINEV